MADARPALLIAGPTASGKSALAIRIAQQIGGVVINCDSMQVYRDLAVITARPTPEDEALVPHRLYGHIDGAVNASVGHYMRDARAALAEADRLGLVPIFTGGTGLYAKALLQGLSDMPAVPEAVRQAVRAEAEDQPTPALHDWLARLDPDAAARLRPSDRLRVLRALEVVTATGRPLAEAHRQPLPPVLAGRRVVSVFLAADREAVRTAVDRRFLAMIEAGALAEVSRLAARGLDPLLPVMRAHGVPGLIAHLSGDISLDEAIARGQADTRAYVKRQFTWFRHQMPDVRWTATGEAEAVLMAALRQP